MENVIARYNERANIARWLRLIAEIIFIVALLNACFGDEYHFQFLKYSQGTFDENGAFVGGTLNTVCANKTIECTKLKIDCSFTSNYTVTLYFYNEEGNQIEVRELTPKDFNGIYVVGYYDKNDARSMPKDAHHVNVAVTDPTGFTPWEIFWLSTQVKISASTEKQALLDAFISSLS